MVPAIGACVMFPPSTTVVTRDHIMCHSGLGWARRKFLEVRNMFEDGCSWSSGSGALTIPLAAGAA